MSKSVFHIVFSGLRLDGQGGVERVTVAKANALAAMPGMRVTLLLTHDVDRQKWHFRPDACVQINLLDVGELSVGINFFEKLRRRVKYFCAVRKWLADNDVNAIVSLGQGDKMWLPFVTPKGVRCVREFHEDFFSRQRFVHARLRRLYARVLDFVEHRLVLPSYDTVQVLCSSQKALLPHLRNIKFIPNLLTIGCGGQTPMAERPKTVMCAARLVPDKNVGLAIKAFARFFEKHGDWRLKIYGTGPQQQCLMHLANVLGIAPNVDFEGFCNDIESAYNDARMFVLPSDYEPFGLVLTEAMACGTPVIACNAPVGPGQIIGTDVRKGLLVPCGDAASLADAMCRIADDPGFAQSLADEAYIQCVRRYSAHVIVPRLLAVYGFGG